MRSFTKSSKALMTNARCLTEGVDLPAIDCVVFTDPKKSKIDIVQAAGRALRLSPGKKFGYILIPIFVPENEDPNEASKDTAFEELVSVVGCLSTQDTRIAEYLRSVTEGKIPQRGSPIDGIVSQKNLTKINAEEFNKAIAIKIWDKISRVNFRSYEETKKFIKKFKLIGNVEWERFKKNKNLPQDIYSYPRKVFMKSNEWKGWEDFLGYKMMPFLDLKLLAQKNNIRNLGEWVKFSKTDKFPPNGVQGVSAFKEFKGYRDFFKTNNYLSFEDAKKIVKKFNFKNTADYLNFTKSKNFDMYRYKLSARPSQYYKDEWLGFLDYIGIDLISFEEARKFARSLNLKTLVEWSKYTRRSDFPNNIPKTPNWHYRDSGWKTVMDFLGTEKKYCSYGEAKKFAQKLKMRTSYEWTNTVKNMKNFPENMSKWPKTFFEKKKEWLGWKDFLGDSYEVLEKIRRRDIIKRTKVDIKKRYIVGKYKITEKQKIFAEIFVNNISKIEGKMTPEECAKKAGYKSRPRQAASELKNPETSPDVCEYIKELKKKLIK